MIPKIIHYCWFGKKKKPKEIIKCISSWNNVLTDYTIMEWNESNTDLRHPFVQHYYKQKKWAFVSDYIRLKVLFEMGGIYLDTDMLVIKKLDDLLSSSLFLGAEDNSFINAAIIGSKKNNTFILDCLHKYNHINYSKSVKELTIPKVITNLFLNQFKINNFQDIIEVDGIKIYPKNYFYPFPESRKYHQNLIYNYVFDETYTIHLWLGSWMENQEFAYIRNKKYLKALKKIVSNRSYKKYNFNYFRKLLSCFKESLAKK